LGSGQGKTGLPRRQDRGGATARAGPSRRRDRAAELGSGDDRGLAGQVGSEPDADQRVDAQIRGGVRLPEGDVPAENGAGLSKSAASRRFVALSAERMTEWMASDISDLDLLVIQIDGIHIEEDLVLLAAVGVDSLGDKHPLAVIEGAAENATVAQALLDNLIERGLDPKVCTVHRRRSQSAEQGDSQNLWPPHPDPALPSPQSAQHPRASAQAAARLGPRGAASGVGMGRR
jgi:hypothetical protein